MDTSELETTLKYLKMNSTRSQLIKNIDGGPKGKLRIMADMYETRH